MLLRNLFWVCVLCGAAGLAEAAELFPLGSSWKYYLGTQEASNPIDAWRAGNFDDSAWPVGAAPVGYGENNIVTTIPSSSRGGWLSVFFRKSFVVSNPANVSRLDLAVLIDDGYVVWINGHEVGRYNVPTGELTFDAPDQNSLPQGAIEQTSTTVTITNELSTLLVAGTNWIAVQVFNANRTSSDLVFDASLGAAADVEPPAVVEVIPPPGATVRTLAQIEVMFSENVAGVDAADLLVNGTPATDVDVLTPSQYVFSFPQPANGKVQVAWSPSHGIHDLATVSNNFAGGAWTYTVDPNAVPPGLIISEFMADNKKTLHDEDGDDSDWIEILNAGTAPASLNGWGLTTRADDLAEWRFPNLTLAANEYLVVFASQKDRTNAPPFHTNFRLNKEGGYLALVDPTGKAVSAFAPAYPAQLKDVSYGRDRVDPNLVAYYVTPTPGKPNSTGGPGFAPEVRFSAPSMTFSGAFALVLSTASSNAVIHYTLSTNLPTESSPLYTQPVPVSGTVHVRARAFETGLLPGPVHSETYVQLAAEVANFSSDLPIVVLHNLGGGTVPASADQFVTVEVFEPGTGPSALTNAPDLAARGIFHKRGRSTSGLPKASFFLEIQDEFGAGKDVSLAGLPEESDWVLYAPNGFEPVLIHNPMAHEIVRQMGRYSPRTRFVEVYLKDDNGTPGPITAADYNGIYVIEEKIKIGKNRVDIDKLQPENTTPPTVTGGYLLSIDSAPPGSDPFYGAGTPINYLEPNYSEITSPQRNAQEKYINDYFNAFGNALNGANWTNPVTGYAAYIDVDAAIDHQLQGVVTFNVDALRLSGYFHKPRHGKLTMGPVWDFDRTQGSTDGRDFNPRLWRSTSPDYGTDMFNSAPIFNNPWYSRMFQDIDFWQKWIDRYEALRRDVLSTTNIHSTIDKFADQVRQAQPREVARWASSGISPRSGTQSRGGYSYNFPGTYQGEVDFMKTWYADRLDFIDGQLVPAPRFSREGGAVSAGESITLSAPGGGTIYYTLDGTDPRLAGGAVSPLAKVYGAALKLTANARVTARCQDLNHQNLTGSGNPPLSSTWSGPVSATFVVAMPTLVITKIMYHPSPSPAGGTNENDNFEYLELMNVGDAALNLNGFRLTQGVEFQFPDLTLAAGQRAVVVKDVAAFRSRYGDGAVIAGVFSGQLDNSGERLVLKGPLGEPILDFSYDNTWYPVTDGLGFALVIANEHASLGAWSNPASWRSSGTINGAPGAADPAPPAFPNVLVNEVLTHPSSSQADSIELYNAGDTPANIGGWLLTDDFNMPRKYRVPTGTIIPPRGFQVFTATDINPGGPGSFSLNAQGEDVYLFSADAATNLTGYVHGLHFGAAEQGVSFGRYVTSEGAEHCVAQTRVTLGGVNTGPLAGPVVVNEIMYHPRPVFSNNNNTRDEFIELRNLSTQETPLYHPDQPTHTWHLRGGVEFDFPVNLKIPPQGYLLVVGFDPLTRPGDLAAFRAAYRLDSSVPVLGPWSGQLDNQGEPIRLLKPTLSVTPDTTNAGPVVYVLVDEVDYSNAAPWPTNANASGNSLQRIQSAGYGNDPINWQAASPTPAALNPVGALDTDGDGLPDAWELLYGLNPLDATGDHGAAGDPDHDRFSNLEEYLSGTSPTDSSSYLRVESIQPGAGGVKLRFQAAAGKSYSLLYRVEPGAGVWLKLTDLEAQSAAAVREVIDPVPGESTQRFYRLVTPALP